MCLFGAPAGIDSLVATALRLHPEQLQDKIEFVLNNMSPTNVPAKSEGCVLLEEHADQLVCDYLVVRGFRSNPIPPDIH